MIGEAVAVLAIPTVALLAGRALAEAGPQRLPLPVAAGLGALAPAAAVAFFQRSFVEQTAAWAVGLVGWGGLLLGGDPYVLAASMLAGAVWGGLLALPASVPPPPPRPSPVKPEPAAGEPTPQDGEDDEVCIDLICPSCSAVVTFPVYHAMVQCRFCGSRHLVRREDTTLATVIPNAVRDEATVTAAVLAHLRYLKYLELYDRMVRPLVQRRAGQQPHPDPLAPALDGASLAAINAAEARVNRAADAYAARLAPHIKLLAWQPFLAPYWHRSGTLYQVAFGRQEDGSKRMEFAIIHLEGSQLGTATPLPDMGKLSYLKTLRPLYGAPEATMPALPVQGGREELAARLETMHQRRATFPFRAIAVRGVFVPQVEVLVWRPWHAAHVSIGGSKREFLVDGASARVTVEPPPPLPLPAAGPPKLPSHQQIRLAPSRCPVCGAELAFVPDAAAHLCGNCFRLLEASGHRLQPRPYLRDEPLVGQAGVPFWRFPLALRTAEGQVVRDLAHLGDQLDGVLDQVGERPQQQSYFFVPAFRLRLTRGAVRFYRRLWPLLHGAPRTLHAAPFDVTSMPAEVWPLTLPAGEARVFGAMYLALSFTSRDLARTEIRGIRARFLEATLEGEPEPAYLSLPIELVSPFRGLLRSPHLPALAQLAGH
jgi:hypothetical protein